jgi:hypothetical protein
MARMEKDLAFPSCFFFRVVAPLDFEELDCFIPHWILKNLIVQIEQQKEDYQQYDARARYVLSL